MTPYSVLALLFSFLFTSYLIPKWIYRAKKAKLVGKDVHKLGSKKVAEVGGLPVICGFTGGLLVYIAFKVFIFNDNSSIAAIFAAIMAISTAAVIGFVDDLLGWKIGLRQFQKAILSLGIAIPIVVINAGSSVMNFPFVGYVDFGLIYPLVLIPLAIVFTSNAFNMVGGFNGLEAGMGIILLTSMAYMTFILGHYWVAIMGASMVAALLGFMLFNWYPAKIFPGDTLTYSVGALFGIMAIMGNIEKFSVILFSLYILQFFLKLRGMMQKESFVGVKKNGTLKIPKKAYGIEHLAVIILSRLTKEVTERKVVVSLLSVQVSIALITIAYFSCC
ncbi:glycosyl transferase family 4 [Candidatus Woesearchaeota archaeon]|nr:glycosyl transferase family 4 [Candidatus Woesearchaeota archaeon]